MPRLLAALAVICLSVCASRAQDPVLRVALADDRVGFTLAPSHDGPLELLERLPWDFASHGTVIWSGSARELAKPEGLRLPRHVAGHDRLFSSFALRPLGHEPGDPVWPPPRIAHEPRERFGSARSKKGVTCPVDLDDVVALGAAQAVINLQPTFAFLPAEAGDPDPEYVLDVEGTQLRFDPRWVARADTEIGGLTERGVEVIAVVTCAIPPGADRAHPLVHERCDLARAPNRLSAFRLSDRAGVAHYVGFLRFCATRYARDDRRHGRVRGWIIGNEHDAHWEWNNQGEASPTEVLAQHARELRLAVQVIRSVHPDLQVFTSFTHSWALPHALAPGRALPGRELLRGLLTHPELREAPWDVAWHPYPENLFDPRFWNDRQAWLAQDSPKVTLNNLEVLLAELAAHEPRRRVILSEQGFHRPDGPDGEDVQAAAYALAWQRVAGFEAVDAFLLHRHVDHRHEGGLRLGLWSNDPASADPCRPLARRRMHEVFRAAGTPDFETVARFALSIVGREDWRDLRAPLAEVAARHPALHPWQREPATLDLLPALANAQLDAAAAYELRFVPHAEGLLQGVMLHPGGDGRPARATIQCEPARKPRALRFAIAKLGEGGDGVRFAVELDGLEIWSADSADAAPRAVELVLPADDATRRLTFAVSAHVDNAWDHAVWLAPRLTR